MLKEGDIIELKEGDEVYMELPYHFAYDYCLGRFSEIARTEVIIGKDKRGLNTNFLKGRYVVAGTASESVEESHDLHSNFPDRIRVKCTKLEEQLERTAFRPTVTQFPIKIEFYEEGKFENVEPIGKAVATWNEE